MDRLLLLLLGVLRSVCRSRTDLVFENAALRHQLGVLMWAGRQPRATAADRWFWVVLRRPWGRWSEVLVFVKPETVVRWHRAGFRLYWSWRSRRRRRGRPRAVAEVRALVRRLATENPTWVARRSSHRIARSRSGHRCSVTCCWRAPRSTGFFITLT